MSRVSPLQNSAGPHDEPPRHVRRIKKEVRKLAELDSLERSLDHGFAELRRHVNAVDQRVGTVGAQVEQVASDLRSVHRDLDKLAAEFNNYVGVQMRENRLQRAHTLIVSIRQELKNKFGHYDQIRRTTTGILQANDLGIVKKESMSNATEQLMISSPRYWLAPTLVALSAWISDQEELANRALLEAMKRDSEKTALFYALVARRAEKKAASLKWVQRYLAQQNEEDLNRESVVLLDAYASGLFGADSEGVVDKQIAEWIDNLSAQPGFLDKQRRQWADAINGKRKSMQAGPYALLREASPQWNALQNVMEGAELNRTILAYFTDIYQQPASTASLKEQLDDMLDRLVTEFDAEEAPLRRKERLEQLVIDNRGDENRAKSVMQTEQQAMAEARDFTQLLTDAAMHPELSGSGASTQKLAVALSRDWIIDAFADTVAANRARVPDTIQFAVDDGFSAITRDGENEQAVIDAYRQKMDQDLQEALNTCVVTDADRKRMWITTGVLGVIAVFFFFGLWLIGIFMALMAIIPYFSLKNKEKMLAQKREQLKQQYAEATDVGVKRIRAIMAEVVDFRREFSKRDAESDLVLNFLNQITPNQYVHKIAGANRRVRR